MARTTRQPKPLHPGRGAVTLDLDRRRSLRFDFNAMVAYEEATGRDALDTSQYARADATNIRAMLWACLLHEDPNLTLEDVGEIITGCLGRRGVLAEIHAAIMEAVKAAFPEPAGEEVDPDRDPLASESSGQ